MSEKLIHNKYIISKREIVEVKILVVKKSKEFPEGLKYSFVYIKDGKRELGYDNERGKGHHKHYKGKEEKIEFKNIYTLQEKFEKEVEKIITEEEKWKPNLKIIGLL